MKLQVQRLDWDSDFFGFGVGRLTGSIASTAALADALQDSAKQGFQLVYGQCDHADTNSHQRCLEAGGRFVDAKRTYSLSLKKIPATNAPTPLRADDSENTRAILTSLAWQSAEYSRYRVDPDMPHDSWRRMYSTWMKNSLNGKLADAVLVERETENQGGRIIGMVTINQRSDVGEIGLLSVDENYRGLGLGRRLLNSAATLCRSSGCSRIQVVTQGANLPACRAYERAGYQLVDEKHIFHFWIPKR